MSRESLDARRILCPLPVIRTQDRVAKMRPGDVLEVTATDPGVKVDIPTWCRINGHTVLEIDERDDEIVIILKVGEAG